MVAVDVRLDRVDELGARPGHVLLDDAVDVNVRERVQAHVRKVEVDVVADAERRGRSDRLALLARADLGVVRVLRGAAVRDAQDPNLVAALRVQRDRAAHAENVVVGMSCDDEDAHGCLP